MNESEFNLTMKRISERNLKNIRRKCIFTKLSIYLSFSFVLKTFIYDSCLKFYDNMYKMRHIILYYVP